MQKMSFYANGTRTVLNCVIEPLKEGDQVYVVSEGGKVYKWDNTVTETTTEYLEHFSEVSVNDCPISNNCSCCSDSSVSFIDIVEKEATKLNVKYESNKNNPFKTERFLLSHITKEESELFPNSYKKLSFKDNLSAISEWIINVDKNAVDDIIPDGYKHCKDTDELKQILTSVLTLSINDPKVNRMVAIIKAIKEYCDTLKATNDHKKQSDNKEDKKADSNVDKKADSNVDKKAED